MRGNHFVPHWHFAELLLLIFLGGCNPAIQEKADPQGDCGPTLAGGWRESAKLPSFRHFPATAFLNRNTVLVAGGYRNIDEDLVETFLIDLENSRISEAAPLHRGRHNHSAWTLASGNIAVLGGVAGNNSIEVFQVNRMTWTAPLDVSVFGEGYTACVLPKHGLLVSGGVEAGKGARNAYVYSETDSSISPCSPMEVGRFGHSMTQLPSGSVLVVGGYTEDREIVRHVLRETRISRSSELYNPELNRWISTGPLNIKRSSHEAVLLGTGEVLVAGGWTSGREWTDSCELYDPRSGKWIVVEGIPQFRGNFRLCPMGNGDALLVGGVLISEKGDPLPYDANELRRTFRFKSRGRKWCEGPPVSVGRTHFSLCWGKSGAFILGGFTPRSTTTSEYLEWQVKDEAKNR